MVGWLKNILWWCFNGGKTIGKPLMSMVPWKKTLNIPLLQKMTFAQVYYLPTNRLTWVSDRDTCMSKNTIILGVVQKHFVSMVNGESPFGDIFSAVWSFSFGETKLRMLKDLSEHRPPVNLCLSNGLMKWLMRECSMSQNPEERHIHQRGHKGFLCGCHFWRVWRADGR